MSVPKAFAARWFSPVARLRDLAPPFANLRVRISVDRLGKVTQIVMTPGTQTLSRGTSLRTGLEELLSDPRNGP